MFNKIITITSDLGDQFATAQLRAVVAGLGFEGQLIENHDVTSYEIVEGAYGIWQLAKVCPPGTVHLGVVDPGVGSERAGIVIKTKNFWFVGPDNGLLYPACRQAGLQQVWRIQESWFGKVANTFHGRDVFIKSAVYLAQGKKPQEFGCILWDKNKITKLEFQDGQVLHIDRYGNAKLWSKTQYSRLRIQDEIIPFVKTFTDVETGKPLVLEGSSDTLEIAVNLGSAKDYFGLKLGQVIKNLCSI